MCKLNTFPIYIYLSANSSADNIISFLNTIRDTLKEENIIPIGISTDSDSAYRHIFNDFFQE